MAMLGPDRLGRDSGSEMRTWYLLFRITCRRGDNFLGVERCFFLFVEGRCEAIICYVRVHFTYCSPEGRCTCCSANARRNEISEKGGHMCR